MIRNLKVLVVAAMALASLGAFAASAHAAEEKFHCSVEPCRVTARGDGTGKTAHQVFVVKDTSGHEVSFTCNGVTAEATSSTKTATALIFSNINYGTSSECSVNGSPGVTVVTTGCTYEFKSAGGGAAPGAGITVACETGKQIEIKISGCTFTVGGTQNLVGARYHNLGTKEEVTVENSNIENITTTVAAGGTEANCHVNPSQTLTSKYITGNVIATGETEAGVMANAWWE